MGKITVTKEELDFYKSDKDFLNQAFRNSIIAQDFTALELLFKLTNLKSCLKISPEELFYELVPLVGDNNNVKIIELIINEFKVDLSQQKDSVAKVTLLDQAAIYGAVEIVSFLLSKGFNPNNKDFQGQTSVHRAVIAKSPETINELIKGRANINIQNNDGNTPLHLATLLQFNPIVQQLKFLGAQPQIKNNAKYDYSTLHKLVATKKVQANISEVQQFSRINTQNSTKEWQIFIKLFYQKKITKNIL
ncbi:MAG: ankyrin repeat domain-containing protein [Rickettsia endosymbiont of Platyusa sonomae]|nr:ankyrin repeat domain-containing protein [Rickettsia endosymbiont of Platyusa sonomae]